MVVPSTPCAPEEPPKKKVDLASQFLADLTSITKAIPEPEQQTPAENEPQQNNASSEEDGDGGWADFAGPAEPTPVAPTQPANAT